MVDEKDSDDLLAVTWLGEIAQRMHAAGHDDQDVTLVETAEYLLHMDRDHQPETSGCRQGQCRTCDDCQGILTDWPCGQWWQSFHFAMRWLMRMTGPAGPPCPCYPDGRAGWGERLPCGGVHGRTDGCTHDETGRVQVPWQPPTPPGQDVARAGDEDRRREQAAERQRRKRERDRQADGQQAPSG